MVIWFGVDVVVWGVGMWIFIGEVIGGGWRGCIVKGVC